MLKSLSEAKRPVIIAGAGVRLANAGDLVRELSRTLNVPVAPTWAALDMFPSDDPLTIGCFGTHGNRAANFAVQNADWILALGSRLDTKATGTPVESFARDAEIAMVDIDQHEMNKHKPRIVDIHSDVLAFVGGAMDGRGTLLKPTPENATAWLARIAEWKRRYPIPDFGPYRIIRKLSERAAPGDIIVTDTGCTVAWTAQAWRFKEGQRFIHAWNQTPMGYALPAAIGAHYATGKRITVLTGDGSIMMSLAELATIHGRDLPITVHLFDNGGHAMCRQTQREWLGSQYPATSEDGGLTFPDWHKLAAIWPRLYVHTIDPDAEPIPKVKYGYPNEDGHPLLPWDEFCAQMITKPLARPE